MEEPQRDDGQGVKLILPIILHLLRSKSLFVDQKVNHESHEAHEKERSLALKNFVPFVFFVVNLENKQVVAAADLTRYRYMTVKKPQIH